MNTRFLVRALGCTASLARRSATLVIVPCILASLCFAPLGSRGSERAQNASYPTASAAQIVYWYDANGNLVSDPEGYVQEGGVFSDGIFRGTMNATSEIIDPFGSDIGRVGPDLLGGPGGVSQVEAGGGDIGRVGPDLVGGEI